MRILARFGAVVALTAIGCGDDAACIIPPCALPFPVELTVTDSASHGPVPGASVDVTGALLGHLPCDVGAAVTTCHVPGALGTLVLDVSAPGYRTVRREVAVTGTVPACGCVRFDDQRIALTLARGDR